MMTSEITKRQLDIIQAAGRILTESGVGGLTTKNLAKAMGFSESAIYRHFTGKEEIILALLNYLADSMDSRCAEVLKGKMNAEEKFEALFKSQFTFFQSNPHFVVAVFSDGLLEESEQINLVILRLMQVKMKYLMPIIMEGQKNKIFTNQITAEEMIHIIMGTFRLHMFKWRLAAFQYDIQRQGENMIHALLTILKHCANK